MAEGTVSYSRGGLALGRVRAFAVGATRRPTKASTEKAPKFWQGIELARTPDGPPELVFTDRECYERVHGYLVDAGKPVELDCELRFSSGAMNLDDAQKPSTSVAGKPAAAA